jgi:hypothetical protein
MASAGQFIGKVWRRFRGLRWWWQALIGFLVVTLVVGPFVQEDESTDEKVASKATTTTVERSTSTSAKRTTTTERRTTTTTEKPTTTTAKRTTTTAKRTTTTLSLEKRAERSNDGTVRVYRSDFGNKWPLTVSGGILSCRVVQRDPDLQAVVFGPSDDPYRDDAFAVNGTARSRADDYGWRDDIEVIWADNPEIEGTKKNIGPLIDFGLSLCPD